MADAADSKSVGRKAVWVRLPPPAPYFLQRLIICRIELNWPYRARMEEIQRTGTGPPRRTVRRRKVKP